MRISEARHRQVVATSTATGVGRVDGFVVTAGPGRIESLRLGKVDGAGSLVTWSDLSAFGVDAVTVATPDVIRGPRDEGEKRASGPDCDLIGKPAIAETGAGLGTVTDAEFDPETGAIRTIMTDRQEIPGDALIGLGAYAAVFSRDAAAPA